MCVLNVAADPIELPGDEVILASAPLVDRKLPPETAAWLT